LYKIKKCIKISHFNNNCLNVPASGCDIVKSGKCIPKFWERLEVSPTAQYRCKNPQGVTVQKILQLMLTAVTATNLNVTLKIVGMVMEHTHAMKFKLWVVNWPRNLVK
jgi:hypothetical protein